MKPIDEKLYKYLGSKELSFGCKVRHWDAMNPEVKGEEQIGTVTENQGRWIVLLEGYTVEDYEIIGHEPRIDDLHKWMNDRGILWFQDNESFEEIKRPGIDFVFDSFQWDSSKSLLQQSDTTKEVINKLFEEYETN